MANDATELYAQIRTLQAKLGDANAATDIATQAGTLRQAAGCTGSRSDDEMRMAALDGLMSMNSQDAIPILEAVLKQRDPCRAELRKRAVFMIAQKRGSSVVPTSRRRAHRPEHRRARRRDLLAGSSQAEAAIPALDSIIFQSKDDEVRKKAIFALSQQRREWRGRRSSASPGREDPRGRARRRDLLARTERDRRPRVLQDALQVDEKHRASEQDPERRRDGTVAGRVGVAARHRARQDLRRRDPQERDLLGVTAARNGSHRLNTLYDQSRGEDEIEEHILFIYSQRRESAAVDKLMSVARSDPNTEMRKKALFWLGQKNDPRIKAFILELINK